MHGKPPSDRSIFGMRWNSLLGLMIVLVVLLAVILFIVLTAHPAQGQTYIKAGVTAFHRLV